MGENEEEKAATLLESDLSEDKIRKVEQGPSLLTLSVRTKEGRSLRVGSSLSSLLRTAIGASAGSLADEWCKRPRGSENVLLQTGPRCLPVWPCPRTHGWESSVPYRYGESFSGFADVGSFT